MKKSKIYNFILLIICSAIYIAFAVGSSSNTATTSSKSQGTVSQTSKIIEYKLNEDIYITNNYGKYRLKFNKVYETNERNQFSDTIANRVVIIEYEYENLTQDDDLYVSDMMFKAYDKENNKLETYPADTKYGGTVSTGRKASSSVAYALNSNNNYIEIEYYDNVWNNKADCKIIIEW